MRYCSVFKELKMSPSKFIHFIFTKSPFCVRPLGIYPCLHGAYILEEMNV